MRMNTTNTTAPYDITIVGGGLVGGCLAKALSTLPIRIALIESVPPLIRTQPDYDARTLALSHTSRTILQTLKLWQDIEPHATPIKNIHASSRGHFGATRISSKELNVDSLGAVVEMQYLLSTLNNAIASQPNLAHYCPAKLTSLAQTEQLTTLTLDNNQTITTKLLIAADGSNSKIRSLLNIPTTTKDYHQHAIVANVSLKAPNVSHTAYERFTHDNLMALLPLSQDRCALILAINSDQTDSLLNYSTNEFLHYLQTQFGYRLGRFTNIGKRTAFPLKMTSAQQQSKNNCILLGNAAHTLHPIAGQGFNLGLRDASALAQVIADAVQQKLALNTKEILHNYLSWRSPDQKRTTRFTDNIISLFTLDLLPLNLARNSGLITLDITPQLKRLFARHAMGYYGRMSQLAVGNEL